MLYSKLMVTPHYLAGRALLALPGIGDPRFEHSVIYLCKHDAHGAMGIGINELITDVGFHDMLEQCGMDQGGGSQCAGLCRWPDGAKSRFRATQS